MSVKLKPLAHQVIVITGATSGIGLDTAKRAAAKGAKLVIVSRSPDVLAKIEREIRETGGDVIHVVADVGSRAQMEAVAEKTVETYGRIDTWINNAGIGVFGRLVEISEDDHRHLFDTNFWGVVNGSLVAVKYMDRSGGGKIINLGSVASDIGFPLQAMYAASKHAIKAFTDGLRQELEAEKAPISITLIKPSAIGTPFGNKAKSYLAKEAQLPPPLYDVSEVGRAIVYACDHHIRDIYIGGGGRILSGFNQMFPALVDLMSSKQLIKATVKNEPARPRHDNLYHGASYGMTRGHDLAQPPIGSLYTRAIVNPKITSCIVAGAAIMVLALRPKRIWRA